MANRRFEMYQYRQVIVRMRLGESDRAIAQSGLMGRKKARSVRELANTRGWLNPDNDIPQETELAACFDQSHARPQTTSLVEPHAEEVKKWAGLGIQGTTIYQALIRKYGFKSYLCSDGVGRLSFRILNSMLEKRAIIKLRLLE